MKLHIKKSKIIVPALGLLLLSTAASVSGSVAWFTANRTFNTEIGSFAVTKLDGDLACAFTAGVGTELEASDNANIRDSNNKVLVVKTGGKANVLGDASFNHTNNTMFTDDPDVTTEAGVNTTKFLSLGTASEANWKVADNVYYGVQWTMTFTYTYGANTNAVGLFFDSAASAATGDSKSTDAAFRIAFVSTDSIVWAPKQAVQSPIQQYVSSATAMADYTTDNLICSGETITKKADGAASASDREYLGSFSTGAETATLEVTCTAWFDGSYLNNTMTTYSSLKAGLAFYTRRLAA